MPDQPISFSFGKNWQRFLDRHYDEGRVETARQHLLGFLGLPDLRGKTFLDVGSGSGLHSLSAFRSGAERVVSFDVDPHSVAATRSLKEREPGSERWEVLEGSVLDERFVRSLARADIVYSWGVLHHTGSMWKAIENAATRMEDGGLFYLALYTTTHKSAYWLRVKKEYNAASELQKRWMEAKYVLRHRILPDLLTFQNTLRKVREYPEKRGMSFMTDVRDWLGGYPYEDAKIEEVLEFARGKLDLELVRIATGEANTEYLLQPR